MLSTNLEGNIFPKYRLKRNFFLCTQNDVILFLLQLMVITYLRRSHRKTGFPSFFVLQLHQSCIIALRSFSSQFLSCVFRNQEFLPFFSLTAQLEFFFFYLKWRTHIKQKFREDCWSCSKGPSSFSTYAYWWPWYMANATTQKELRDSYKARSTFFRAGVCKRSTWRRYSKRFQGRLPVFT